MAIPLFLERLLLICSGILIAFALKFQFIGLGGQAAAIVGAVSEASDEASEYVGAYGTGGTGLDHELVTYSDQDEYEALEARKAEAEAASTDARLSDALEKARKAGEWAAEEIKEDLWNIDDYAEHLTADPHFLF